MQFIFDVLGTILTAFVALFPIVNPIGTVPLFISRTEQDTTQEKNRQAFKASIYFFCILTIFLLAGDPIMKFFGISIPAIRIAGGLILHGMGFNMLRAQPKYKQTQLEEIENQKRDDISFTPMAMPMLSGPGSIAVTLGLTDKADTMLDYGLMTISILIIAIIAFIFLRASKHITKVMGINGMNVMTRMMGFITICISVQFIIVGVIAVLE